MYADGLVACVRHAECLGVETPSKGPENLTDVNFRGRQAQFKAALFAPHAAEEARATEDPHQFRHVSGR